MPNEYDPRLDYHVPAVGEEQYLRWDAPLPRESPTFSQLDYGEPPSRIPRLWNLAMRMLSGARQLGYRDDFDTLKLSPPIIPVFGRSRAAIADALVAPRYADGIAIPAIYVDWSPEWGQVRR